jgi:CubicO group peptidase (beta-lactamase class C family)
MKELASKINWGMRSLLLGSLLPLNLIVVNAQGTTNQSAPSKQTNSHPFAQTVDAVAPGFLREFGVPGVAVALIQKGEVVWMRGYGSANIATAKPLTPETVFNVGSLSKMATAWGRDAARRRRQGGSRPPG